MKRAWRLALDFDGVINSYVSGYLPGDDSYLPDPPTKGAKEFILKAMECFEEVIIVSTRARTAKGVMAMHEWLRKYDLPNLNIFFEKLPATVYLDDRAILFKGKFPSIQKLAKFNSWINDIKG